jgi:hypothetical protein
MSGHTERIQQEITEIAEVLARQQGRELREVWEEAMTLWRVRFSTEVRPPPDDE